MLGQSKVSTAEEIFFLSSNSKSLSELLHIQKVEFGGDMLLITSKTSDLDLKIIE